jgi:transposase
MLTWGEEVEAHALRERGWTISAIARHLGRDRQTVRDYLNGTRTPGVRVSSEPDALEPFLDYIKARFGDDKHVWATALFDEVKALGYERSYTSFARQLRDRGLRPHCEACAGVKGRDTVIIDHPPGEETQWDWFERRKSPWGTTAYVLLGSLSYAGRTRGVITESTDQPHLIDAMDGVMRRLGGTTKNWRVDRMTTVINPATGDVQASFAPVAKHYGAIVVACPPRRGNRKGVVESAVRFATGRWWKSLSATTMEEAQASLDTFWSTTGDARLRSPAKLLDSADVESGRWPTVGELANAEPLMPLPAAAYPVTIEVSRIVTRTATVAFRGNSYSVPPGMSGSELLVRHRVGTNELSVLSPSGLVVATHRLGVAGTGGLISSHEHREALEKEVLAGFTSASPCNRKENRPPGQAALEARAALLGNKGNDVTVDLGAMEQAVRSAGGVS